MWSCPVLRCPGIFFVFAIQIFRQGRIPLRHRTGFWPLAAQVWCLWLAGSGSGLKAQASGLARASVDRALSRPFRRLPRY